MDTALREYPEIVKQYFGTVIPPGDNKFAALNSAVWSGGSFIYVPPGVDVRDAAAGLLPHQPRERRPVRAHADHRRRGRAGALHRGLLGAGVHERLAALGGRRDRRQARAPASPTRRSRTGRPTSTTSSPSGPGSRPRATWSGSTATSASAAHDEVPVGRTWSARRPRARCCRSPTPAPASTRTPGAKMVHAAPETTSKIVSKSISKDGGITTYRGLVRVDEGAYGCKSHVQCDALILDEESASRTPTRTWRSASATPRSATRPPCRRSPTSSSST